MAEYIVLECLDCKHKEIYVNGTSDGKRCEQCNSGMYFPIDSGNKSELMTRYNMREQKRWKYGTIKIK